MVELVVLVEHEAERVGGRVGCLRNRWGIECALVEQCGFLITFGKTTVLFACCLFGAAGAHMRVCEVVVTVTCGGAYTSFVFLPLPDCNNKALGLLCVGR